MNWILHLPLFWYKDSFLMFKNLLKNLLVFIDNKLAVSLMGQMLLVPLFHDDSFLGRILSFIYRLVRVIIGSLLIVLAGLAGIVWFAFWLVLPPLVVIMGNKIGWVSLAVVWLIDAYRQVLQPKKLGPNIGRSKANLNDYLDKDLKKLLLQTKLEPARIKQVLVADSEVKLFLDRLEISPNSFAGLNGYLLYKEWLAEATKIALSFKDEQINKIHFTLALLKIDGWHYQSALRAYKWSKKIFNWSKTYFLWEKEYQARPMGGVNRALTGVPTPTLDKYSLDLTQMAQKLELPEMFGKEEILAQMGKILAKKQQNNILIIGEPGSGKTTLVKGMAQEIVRGVKNRSLKFKRVVKLDLTRLVAGAETAELNKRMAMIIEEIKAAANIILFIDEVHNLASINQSQPETSQLFNALEPVLSEGAFQFIGATTTENYKKYIEPNEAFARLFEKVDLKEAGREETLDILEYLSFKLEKDQQVFISELSLEKIVDLGKTVIRERVFPDKAINILDEVVAGVKESGEKMVTSNEVEKLISKKTKIPGSKISKQEAEKLLKLEERMHQRVIGQEEAVKAVADALRRARTKLKDPDKPMASFLFAGPTGVGKTETAKALAEEFFGSEKQMVRLDMSEYQNQDSLNRLIGPPPGKLINSGGQLTEAIRHQPYTLLLLDEIEKAHPKILNLFLQVLDEARLTDSQGKVVNFSNTIIIATTNVGTKELIQGFDKAREALENHYPPEFLNRFTGLIIFKNLTQRQVAKIVQLKLNQLSRQLEKQEIRVKFSKKIVDRISELGFSSKWGGRQVERVIQKKILNVIAKNILKKELEKGQQFLFQESDLD